MPSTTAVETFLMFEVKGMSRDTFKVAGVSGAEAISSLFQYELDLCSPDHDLEYAAVLGKKGHLIVKGADAERHVHGLVSRIELVGRSDDQSRYRLTLVPSLWPLGLRRTCRIFQEKSVPDIVKKVLKDAGVPDDEVKLQVHGDHQPWEYCVQYRESDLAFISRLMEQEGMFHFYEHASGKATLRIGDDTADHPPAPDVGKLPLRAGAGIAAGDESLSSFHLAEEVRPDAFVLRDYQFKTPGVDLTADAKERPGIGTEVYDYPGDYDAPGEGEAVAKLRLQELRALRRRGAGAANCARLTPGHTFEVVEHPRRDHNGKYMLVGVAHEATQPQVLGRDGAGKPSTYAAEFTCIPADVPFRPPRLTPRPAIRGIQTALVVGPSGEEIHTDEHGRIKVQFHWDREGKKDENSSCWIRVAQPWAGAGWGAFHIPRMGQEVIVEFLEGDPDQPIVTGAVYHADNQPPYPLPAEKTKSTLKSNSTKGGDGFNEMRFEDAKGSEEIFLHGQKDWNIVIENDETDDIKANRTVKVGKNEDVTVGENRRENVGKDESITIGANRKESVGKDETITISGKRAATVSQDESLTVSGGRTVSIAKDDGVTISGSRSLNVDKDLKEGIGAGATLTVGKDQTVDVGKAFSLTAGKEIALKVGGAELIMKSDGKIQIKGSDINIKASGNVTIKGAKVVAN